MIKFKYYKTDEKFQSDVLNSKINTDDIVFVEDLHTITTHGEEFGGTQVQSNWTQSNSEAADYIKNKPTIPDAQIQSDWTLTNTSAKDYIKNKPSLHTVATSGSYSDLTDKPTLFSGNYNDLSNKPSIPDALIQSDWNQTNTSAKDYIKNKPSLFSGSYNDLSNKPTIPSLTGYATESWVNAKFDDAFGINADGVSTLAAVLSDNDYTTGILTQIANKVDKETGKGLSSNDYTTTEKNKLAGIATGATAVTESTVSGWGFTKNTGTLTSETDPVFTASAAYGITSTDISNWNAKYSKPTNGIPASDLADDAKEHEYVDLGLPSGTLWATVNVGATSVTDYGNYYMYGMGAKTYDSSDTPYQGTEDTLPEEYDTAAQVWGEGWRMPTYTQIQELTINATYQWVTNYQGSGINGGLFTGLNGNTIFLPAAGSYSSNGSLSSVGSEGLYWSATPIDTSNGRSLYFYSSDWYWNISNLACGYLVRPVHAPFPVSPAKVKDALGINSSTGSTTKYLNEQGSFTTIASDSNKQDKITASGLLKGNGSGTVSAAIAGTDYQAPLTFNTAPSSSNKVATMADIPTSLPANGGNADTVDGYHYNNLPYLPHYKDSSLDANDAVEGWHDVMATIQNSANTGYYSTLINVTNVGTPYQLQICDAEEPYIYKRYNYGNGSWSNWFKMSAGYADTAGSASASDVYSWAKASTKPSYTLDEVTDGSTRALSNYLPLSGGTMSGAVTSTAFKQTYTNPTTAASYTLSPNVEYFLNTISQNTTFTLGTPESSVVNEYKFQFDMGSTAYTISGLSASIIWQGGVPSFEASKHYEISIKYDSVGQRYFGLCSSFDLT